MSAITETKIYHYQKLIRALVKFTPGEVKESRPKIRAILKQHGMIMNMEAAEYYLVVDNQGVEDNDNPKSRLLNKLSEFFGLEAKGMNFREFDRLLNYFEDAEHTVQLPHIIES